MRSNRSSHTVFFTSPASAGAALAQARLRRVAASARMLRGAAALRSGGGGCSGGDGGGSYSFALHPGSSLAAEGSFFRTLCGLRCRRTPIQSIMGLPKGPEGQGLPEVRTLLSLTRWVPERRPSPRGGGQRGSRLRLGRPAPFLRCAHRGEHRPRPLGLSRSPCVGVGRD